MRTLVDLVGLAVAGAILVLLIAAVT